MTLPIQLDPEVQTELLRVITPATQDGRTPGAQVAIAHRGVLVAEVSSGVLATHDGHGDPLPREAQQPVTLATRFDLASISKFFTAITLHVLVERGLFGYDEPLATHLRSYLTPQPRSRVTLRMLLTHTSGLPDIWAGWREPLRVWRGAHPGERTVEWPGPGRESLIDDLLSTPLAAEPGSGYVYSCAGYNTAMVLAEKVTGRPFGELVRELALRPLGLDGPITAQPGTVNTAATEVTPERGVIVGQVHDEASWSLGGGTGNAGLFGNAHSLVIAAEALRTDGLPCSSQSLWHNEMPDLLGRELADPEAAPWGHSMGLRIGQLNWMAGAQSRGHTGFTGTSFLTDREAELSVVLLTNRVHPSRDGDIVHTLRRQIAEIGYQLE